MDFYKVLGIEKNATEEDIKSAYRKMAMKFHPDRNPGDKEAEQQFKDVQTAYDTLNDPIAKSRYDGAGTRSSAHPFSGIWDAVFNKNNAPKERGRNIQITVEIELKDVLTGVSKDITIPKREKCGKCDGNGFTEYKPCNTCHGSGKTAFKQSPFNIWMACNVCHGTGRAGAINCLDCKNQGFITTETLGISIAIPSGVETGHQMRVTGYGEPSKISGGQNGDLNIIILVKEHNLFRRHGVNLTCEFPVGFSELCLGCNLEVPTLTGAAVITVPPNTSDYTQLRLKGMGLPYFHGGKGDLIIILKLIIPSQDDIHSNKKLLKSICEFEKKYLTKEREKFKGA